MPVGEGQIAGVAEKFFPSFVGLLKASDEDAAEKEAAFVEQLKQLDTYLAENGPYLGGEEMKAPDAMLVRCLLSRTVFKHPNRCTLASWPALPHTCMLRNRTCACLDAKPMARGGTERHLHAGA